MVELFILDQINEFDPWRLIDSRTETASDFHVFGPRKEAFY